MEQNIVTESENQDNDDVVVDIDAKCRVSLAKLEDANQQPFYIGKLQMPATLHLKNGASFMVYVSEDGFEEIQIAPVDRKRSRKRHKYNTSIGSRIKLDMSSHTDKNGNVFYVGELFSDVANIDLSPGVFFSFFNSKQGKEQLQISRMRTPSKKPGYSVSDAPNESDSANY